MSRTTQSHVVFPIVALIGCALAVWACDDAVFEQETSDRSEYPSCYGTEENQIIADLSFILPDGESFSFSDIHTDPQNQLLLLTTSAGWCTACIEEQPALQDLHDQYSADGLVVMVALFQYADFRPADAQYAANWRDQYGLSFFVVADPQFVLGAYYDERLTPMLMLVDLNTMEIIRVTTGWDASTTEAIIQARL